MSRRYPKNVHAFLREYIPGHSLEETANAVSERFPEWTMTAAQVKCYCSNNKIKCGTGGRKWRRPGLLTEEQEQYVRKNYKGVGWTQMAKRLNELYGLTLTPKQIGAYYKNHGLNSGLTGHFEKGHVPPNKGKKGYNTPGSEKGWFRNGHTPWNMLPVGSEIVKADGYLWTKISDNGNRFDWRQSHILNWESVNGPVPEKHVLIFLDGNRMNTDVDNLSCVTLQENAVLNRKHLRSEDKELTEFAVTTARLMTATKNRRKK